MADESKDKYGWVVAIISGVFVVVAAFVGIIPDLIEASKPAQPLIVTATPPPTAEAQPTRVEGEKAEASTATLAVLTPSPISTPQVPAPTRQGPLMVSPTPSLLDESAMSDPEKALYRYFQDLANGEYQKAWDTLTPTCIEYVVKQDFEGYAALYKAIDTINVLSLETVDVTNTHHIVKGRVVFATLTSSKVYNEQDYTIFYFLKSDSSGVWKIDNAKYNYP